MHRGHFCRAGRSSCRTFESAGRVGFDILIYTFVLFFLTVHAIHAKGLKVRRNAGGYRVEATINRYPLFLGTNHIEIEIRDDSGKPVTDARVLLNYYMPPMPRMVPMNYKTTADLKDGVYEAEMNIIMAGPWYVKVIIFREGKIATAKFNTDAQ